MFVARIQYGSEQGYHDENGQIDKKAIHLSVLYNHP
jgi:hypothetical protein